MDKIDILADEELIIRDGGEIPEVTFHGSLYYLTEDLDGPKVSLNSEDLTRLKQAVVFCYRRIMLRDLMLENRDKGLYRGLERCRLNWQRMENFCRREQLHFNSVRDDISKALKDFMKREIAEVQGGLRSLSVNCSWEDLQSFCEQLEVGHGELPDGWQEVCS